MKTLFVEFAPSTSLSQLDVGAACFTLLADAPWCDAHPAAAITLRTRLVAINVRVPDHFAVPPGGALGELLGAEVVNSSLGMVSTELMIFFDVLVMLAVWLFIYASVASTKFKSQE